MKLNSVLVLLLIVLTQSNLCAISFNPSIHENEYIEMKDWDWWDKDQYGDLQSPFDVGMSAGVDTKIPGIKHPQNSHKENGWELYTRSIWLNDMKDVKTWGDAKATRIYFALYNKYTGVLRTFIYVPNTVKATDAQTMFVEFSITDGSGNGNIITDHSLLAYESAPYSYAIDNSILYNKKPITYGAGEFTTERWVITDTKLSYDPNLDGTRNIEFTYVVKALKTENINLGGDFSFTSAASADPLLAKENVPPLNLHKSGDWSAALPGVTETGVEKTTSFMTKIADTHAGISKSLNATGATFDWFEDYYGKGFDVEKMVFMDEKEASIIGDNLLKSYKAHKIGESFKAAGKLVGNVVPWVNGAVTAISAISSMFDLGSPSVPQIKYSYSKGVMELNGYIESEVIVEVFSFKVAGSRIIESQNIPYWVKRNRDLNNGEDIARLGLFALKETPQIHYYKDFNQTEKFVSVKKPEIIVNPYHQQFVKLQPILVLPQIDRHYEKSTEPGEYITIPDLADVLPKSPDEYTFAPVHFTEGQKNICGITRRPVENKAVHSLRIFTQFYCHDLGHTINMFSAFNGLSEDITTPYSLYKSNVSIEKHNASMNDLNVRTIAQYNSNYSKSYSPFFVNKMQREPHYTLKFRDGNMLGILLDLEGDFPSSNQSGSHSTYIMRLPQNTVYNNSLELPIKKLGFNKPIFDLEKVEYLVPKSIKSYSSRSFINNYDFDIYNHNATHIHLTITYLPFGYSKFHVWAFDLNYNPQYTFKPIDFNTGTKETPFIDIDMSSNIANRAITFSPKAAVNNSEYTATYQWDFGNGIGTTNTTANHTFPKPGEYDVTLTINYTSIYGYDWDYTETVTKKIRIIPDITPVNMFILD